MNDKAAYFWVTLKFIFGKRHKFKKIQDACSGVVRRRKSILCILRSPRGVGGKFMKRGGGLHLSIPFLYI